MEAGEVTAGIAQVRQFIEQHGESRFSPWGMDGEDRDRSERRGAGHAPKTPSALAR